MKRKITIKEFKEAIKENNYNNFKILDKYMRSKGWNTYIDTKGVVYYYKFENNKTIAIDREPDTDNEHIEFYIYEYDSTNINDIINNKVNEKEFTDEEYNGVFKDEIEDYREEYIGLFY